MNIDVTDFYPRSPCGERLGAVLELQCILGNFYPRSPCGERPPNTFRHCTTYLFLSTLSLRRATTSSVNVSASGSTFLSTLSLRRATGPLIFNVQPRKFLSTLSLRRATERENQHQANLQNFYPRSPCGERPWQRGSRVTYIEISIHALLAESDAIRLAVLSYYQDISIHALLAESDF